jgi:membrane-bound lytic murein transglycosylase D
MKFIYSQLGDWYLSMAGYDWGTGRVQQAVQKTGYADYWELYKRHELPTETQNYVPQIVAAIIIANNPTQYGFDDITLDPPLLTDTVTIDYSVDLRLVSDIVDAPVDELTALNPSLLRLVTPPDESFDLHLPAGTATLFGQRIALIPEARRNAWRYHRVAAADTLASVAREFHVSEPELASVNQLRPSDSVQGLEALVVPAAPVAAASVRTLLYTARKGDTLVTISDRFGVSLAQLRRWNKMTGTKVEPGSRLHLAEPSSVPSSATRAHRRAAAPSTGQKASQAAPATSSTRKPAVRSSQKAATSASVAHAPKSNTSSNAAKNAPSSSSRKHAPKPAAHAKTSTQ